MAEPVMCAAVASTAVFAVVDSSGSSGLSRGRLCSRSDGRRRVVLRHVVHAKLLQLIGLRIAAELASRTQVMTNS